MAHRQPAARYVTTRLITPSRYGNILATRVNNVTYRAALSRIISALAHKHASTYYTLPPLHTTTLTLSCAITHSPRLPLLPRRTALCCCRLLSPARSPHTHCALRLPISTLLSCLLRLAYMARTRTAPKTLFSIRKISSLGGKM